MTLISATVERVLAQTLPAFEIFVVDDGSPNEKNDCENTNQCPSEKLERPYTGCRIAAALDPRAFAELNYRTGPISQVDIASTSPKDVDVLDT